MTSLYAVHCDRMCHRYRYLRLELCPSVSLAYAVRVAGNSRSPTPRRRLFASGPGEKWFVSIMLYNSTCVVRRPWHLLEPVAVVLVDPKCDYRAGCSLLVCSTRRQFHGALARSSSVCACCTHIYQGSSSAYGMGLVWPFELSSAGAVALIVRTTMPDSGGAHVTTPMRSANRKSFIS